MTFNEYVLHQLREMKRELLTAVEGLDAEDLTSFDPAGHWPVAWIAEHCTEVADKFLCKPTRGEILLAYAPHVAKWPEQAPVAGDIYPPLAEIEQRWIQVCDTAIQFVESADDDQLNKEYGIEPYINSILRVVNHTNSHLRSLWCILGERRVDSKFAEQQSFLA